tara:strand:+ start:1758 stop:2420 length:663 start_codon:yes stop_codon:yes gene_type:complete
MARISHTSEKSGSSNPTSKFLEYKSNDKAFSYYDREAKETVKVELPLKFVFLQNYHSVRGWNDASASGIYSNEVFYIGSEPMTVKAFKGGTIATGLYKDIKAEITNAGGKYHRSIYVMLEDGTLANISLKGSSVRQWSDFMEANKQLVDGQFVEVNSANEEKKGSVKYSTPNFTIGAKLSKGDSANADKVAGQLKTYLDEYFSKSIEKEVVEVEEVDLDF